MKSQTPFGTMTDENEGNKAPTKTEVAENPALYDGTSFDPTTQVGPTQLAIANFGTIPDDSARYHTFAEFYQADPQGASAWFQSGGQYGVPLNLAGLSGGQRSRLGLPASGNAVNAELKALKEKSGSVKAPTGC